VRFERRPALPDLCSNMAGTILFQDKQEGGGRVARICSAHRGDARYTVDSPKKMEEY